MKFIKWLKTIYLFPFMLMMGIPDGGNFGEGSDDPANEGGEGQDSETDDGEEQETEVEYELDEDGEVVTDDDGNPVVKQVAEGEEEQDQKGKPDHKKGAQDRIQQLANEKRELAERLERLESQFARQQEEKPDFVDVDIEKVNAYIQNASDQIEELKLEGNYIAAKKLELNVAKIISDIEENDKKKAAYFDKQSKTKTVETAAQERLTKLDQAAEFYRTNMKIEPAVWDKMGTWFAEQCQKNPVLGREFSERVEKGEIGAIRWAHEYTTQNMGVKERAAIDNKNTNKTKAAAFSPTPGGKSAPIDLSKALAKATETNTPEGWVEYQRLKREANKR